MTAQNTANHTFKTALEPVKHSVSTAFGQEFIGLGTKKDDSVIGYFPIQSTNIKREKLTEDLSAQGIPAETIQCVYEILQLSKHVPVRDDYYCFRRGVLRELFGWHRLGNNIGLYLTGDTGAGKTSVVEQVAARIGMPLFTANGHREMSIQDLIGGMGIKNGETVFKEGPLTKALRHGCWFLLNEVDAIPPSTAIQLHEILDGKGITIPETGEYIPVHRYFRLVATANTFGDGMSAHYVGTQRMNLAFMDRFIKVTVTYPAFQEELGILKKHLPLFDESILTIMLKCAEGIRLAFEGKRDDYRCNVTASTRSLIMWGKLAGEMESLHTEKVPAAADQADYHPLTFAFRRTIMAHADEESQVAMMSLLASLLPDTSY